MFRWLYTKSIEVDEEDEVEEVEGVEGNEEVDKLDERKRKSNIPIPPPVNKEIAGKLRKKKYFPNCLPDNLKHELKEAHENRMDLKFDKITFNFDLMNLHKELKQYFKNRERRIPFELKEEICNKYVEMKTRKTERAERMETLKTELIEECIRRMNKKILVYQLHAEMFEKFEEIEENKKKKEDVYLLRLYERRKMQIAEEIYEIKTRKIVTDYLYLQEIIDWDSSESFEFDSFASLVSNESCENIDQVDDLEPIKNEEPVVSENKRKNSFDLLDEIYKEIKRGKTNDLEEIVVDNGDYTKSEEELALRVSLDFDEYFSESFNYPVKQNPFYQEPECEKKNEKQDKDKKEDNKMENIKREYPEGYLELLFGPMFSGKSTRLLFKLSSMADQRFRCLYINSYKDERETESQDKYVTTHNSSYSTLSPKIHCLKVKSLTEVNFLNYDYIAVDEFQFFDSEEDVQCIIDWVTIYGKYVCVASLDGDYSRRKFGRVFDLIPHADEIVKTTAYCDMCRDNYGKLVKAPFTARMTSDTTAELVGGKDIYKAMCRTCHDFHMDVIYQTTNCKN
jgi:thymidine kinase